MMKPESLPESTGKTAWIVKIKRNILLFLITTVSVTLGTMPIIVFCFNRLSLVVLPANMILVPILGLLALPLSMMVIVVSPFSEMLAGLLIHCSAWLIKLSLILIDFLAGLDGAAFYVCTPSLWQIAAFYMLLISGIQMIDLFRQDDIPGSSGKDVCSDFCLLSCSPFWQAAAFCNPFSGSTTGN
jgi:competence protein ComEC